MGLSVLVCVKEVPDYGMVLGADWQAVAGGHPPAIGYASRIANCFDENALELALRLAEQQRALGGACEVHVLSVGAASAEAVLKHCLALGVASATRVAVEAPDELAPAAVAGLVAAFARQSGPFGLVLTGRQAGLYDDAQVPLYTAELLGLRCVQDVIALEAAGPAGLPLRLRHRRERDVQLAESADALVATVGDIEGLALRSCTLKEKLAARQRAVAVLTPEALADAPGGYRVPLRLYAEAPGAGCTAQAAAAGQALAVLEEEMRTAAGGGELG